MKYQFCDGGRSTSKRLKQRQDCVVRAISIVFEKPYDEVYDTLAVLGRKSGRGTKKEVWKKYLNSLGATKNSFPATKGIPRMNLGTFTEIMLHGRFLVQMAGHLTAVIDGMVYDDFCPVAEKCVYTCWIPRINLENLTEKFIITL